MTHETLAPGADGHVDVADDGDAIYHGAVPWPSDAAPRTWLLPAWNSGLDVCAELDQLRVPYEMAVLGGDTFISIPDGNIIGATVLDDVPHAVADTDYAHQLLMMPLSMGMAPGGLHGVNVAQGYIHRRGLFANIGRAIAGNPITLPLVAIVSLFKKGS